MLDSDRDKDRVQTLRLCEASNRIEPGAEARGIGAPHLLQEPGLIVIACSRGIARRRPDHGTMGQKRLNAASALPRRRFQCLLSNIPINAPSHYLSTPGVVVRWKGVPNANRK